MKKYRCGFYSEPLNWTVTAKNEQSAALAFADFIRRNNITSVSGVKEFVVFEVKNKPQKGV